MAPQIERQTKSGQGALIILGEDYEERAARRRKNQAEAEALADDIRLTAGQAATLRQKSTG